MTCQRTYTNDRPGCTSHRIGRCRHRTAGRRTGRIAGCTADRRHTSDRTDLHTDRTAGIAADSSLICYFCCCFCFWSFSYRGPTDTVSADAAAARTAASAAAADATGSSYFPE